MQLYYCPWNRRKIPMQCSSSESRSKSQRQRERERDFCRPTTVSVSVSAMRWEFGERASMRVCMCSGWFVYISRRAATARCGGQFVYISCWAAAARALPWLATVTDKVEMCRPSGQHPPMTSSPPSGIGGGSGCRNVEIEMVIIANW